MSLITRNAKEYQSMTINVNITQRFHAAPVQANRDFFEGVNGVNRLATKGKKYYRLPTKREKNYRLPTGKLLTDYRHGPTLSIFFSERRVYCIFSTFLGSNQRYHVTSLFTNIPQNEDIEIGLQSVCQKFLQPA